MIFGSGAHPTGPVIEYSSVQSACDGGGKRSSPAQVCSVPRDGEDKHGHGEALDGAAPYVEQDLGQAAHQVDGRHRPPHQQPHRAAHLWKEKQQLSS